MLPSVRTVLYRYYQNNGELVRALQGKVFRPAGYDFLVFYRDIHEHKSRLWTENGAWNLDWRTFLWLEFAKVREIHYAWHKNGKLYALSVSRVRKWLNEGKLKVKDVGGHRQLFLPRSMFEERKLDYPVPWIRSETDSGRFVKVRVEKEAPPATMKEYVASRMRLKQIWEARYA